MKIINQLDEKEKAFKMLKNLSKLKIIYYIINK